MFDLLVKGLFRPDNNSPCEIHKIITRRIIIIKLFSKDNILGVFEHENFSHLKNYLQEKSLLSAFVEKLHQQSSGVPIYVAYIFDKLGISLIEIEEGVDKQFRSIINEMPKAIINPFTA